MDSNNKNKKYLERRGYVKDDDGVYRKKTVLEKYLAAGYLDLPCSKFSANDRKLAGEQLCADYFLGNFNTVKSVNIMRINNKFCSDSGREDALFYRERYLNAVKDIPYEFWKPVRIVCIEDKDLSDDTSFPRQSLKNKNNVYYLKMLLNHGLDRLIKFYLQKNKKSS